MTYDVFQNIVFNLVKKAGVKPESVRFSTDTEKGKHYANCDGVTIIGNSASLKMTVKWGSGHMAMA